MKRLLDRASWLVRRHRLTPSRWGSILSATRALLCEYGWDISRNERFLLLPIVSRAMLEKLFFWAQWINGRVSISAFHDLFSWWMVIPEFFVYYCGLPLSKSKLRTNKYLRLKWIKYNVWLTNAMTSGPPFLKLHLSLTWYSFFILQFWVERNVLHELCRRTTKFDPSIQILEFLPQ